MNKTSVTIYVLAFSSFLFTGCSSSSNEPSVSIGSIGPGGGTVFAFLDDSNTTGLEVFPTSIGQSPWGCPGINVDDGIISRPTNGVGVPSGEESSDILLATNESGLCLAGAAELTFQHTSNGFNDWYLPSTDELIAIRDLGLLPGAPGAAYWSSTEDSDQNAFTVLIRVMENTFDSGDPSTSNKNSIAGVIPIRTF